jgi:hypothetical protein
MTGAAQRSNDRRSRERRARCGVRVTVVDAGPLAQGAPEGCQVLLCEAGAGRHRVWGAGVLSPWSLGLQLLGGDRPHIGAVAIGVPRPSLARSARRSATTSVMALLGHKEDDLARSAATHLARRLGVPTVVTAGMHLHGARPEDIRTVLDNTEHLIEAIAAHVAAARRRTRRRA